MLIIPLIFSTSLSYNATAAKHMALLAAITHCPKSQILAWDCSKCSQVPLKSTIYLSNSQLDTMGYIGYSPLDHQIKVIVRGSESTQNWIENLTFEKVPYAGCLGCFVHAGFYTDYNSLKGEMFKAI
jgi:hypothetical protein